MAHGNNTYIFVPVKKEVYSLVFIKKLLYVLVLFLAGDVGCSTIYAQDNLLRFQNIDIDDGLSQSTVYDSYQDQEGFMWFGTRDGLNKFDGYDFSVYREKSEVDTAALNQGTIRAITGDSDGDLWIGTDGGGLYRYSKQERRFEHILADDDSAQDFGTSNILSLAFDDEQNLWIGTRNQGVLKYNIDDTLLTSIENDIGQVWSLAADTLTGQVWAGTDEGLIRIDAAENSETYLPGIRIESIKIEKEQIWIGAYQNGLYRYDISTGKIENIRNIPADISVLSLLTFEEQLWLGTASSGLYIWDFESDEIRHYTSENTISSNLIDNSIRSFYKDRTGTIWIGSNNAGLFTWSKYRSKFALYRQDESSPNTLNNNVVLSFTEDNKGRLWIGTDGGGVNVLDRDQQEYMYYPGVNSYGYDVNNSHIITMLTDSNDNIWIGTDGGGLNKWNATSGTFKYFQYDSTDSQSLSNNSVLTLLEDSNGYIWVGTYKGLNRFDPQEATFRRYGNTHLSDDRILALLEDSDGHIWIGTYAGGLNRLNPETGDVTHFEYKMENEESISSNRIQSLYEDNNDNIWIGTYSGLNRYDKLENKFEVLDTEDGLPNGVIYSVLPDKSGHIWLSTNEGISRLDMESRKVLNFTVHDGLQSNEFNGGAYFRNAKGELFFGGVKGFNIIEPQNIPINKSKPPVEITSFRVSGNNSQSIRENNLPLELSYKQNFFSIEFAALDFVATESNRYRYKLDGFDEDWILSSRNTVRYTNVPPGKYSFIIQAANSDGIWNRMGVTLPLEISPPFWQTWWFRLTILIAVAGFVYGFYRYRINTLLKIQQTRQRIASNLHDEVSATLSSITYFAQAIRQMQNGQKTERFVGLISESAFEAKEKITDIIWAIDPEQDDWVSLLSKCRRFASDLLESKNMEYELNIDTDIAHPLDVEMRQHLWLIFKEMVVNAARHSKAKKVDIFFGLEGDRLRLVVQDNGMGIPDDVAQHSGHGIKNIKKRARQLGAELNLETDRDIGTRWIMSMEIS